MRNVSPHEKRGSLTFAQSLIREKIGDQPRMSNPTPQPSATCGVVLDPENTEEKRTPLQSHHRAACLGDMAGLRRHGSRLPEHPCTSASQSSGEPSSSQEFRVYLEWFSAYFVAPLIPQVFVRTSLTVIVP
jgi:hypothetical protein